MPEYAFVALGFSDSVMSGADPVASNRLPDSDAYGVTTLQVALGATWPMRRSRRSPISI